MSDTFTASDFYSESAPADPVSSLLPEDAAPVDDGQGEVEDTPVVEAAEVETEGDTQEEPSYFDVSQFAGQKVRVKQDGEEIDVPVEELPNGYMRHADYTRKTQEIAQEREQIAFWKQVDEAMKVNPELTIKYLADHHGINLAQPTVDDDDDWGFDQPLDDPIAQRLAQIEQAVQPAVQFAQQQQAERQLQSVVQGLTNKYGDDFNPAEVIAEAIARGVNDPAALEYVYKDMAFDRFRAQAVASGDAQAAKQAAEAQRLAAAQAAAGAVGVGTGSAASAGVAASSTPRQPRSVWEAYEMAKAELGS